MVDLDSCSLVEKQPPYHSNAAAMGGRKAIGFESLDASFAVNDDVSEAVKSQSAYYENVELSRALEG